MNGTELFTGLPDEPAHKRMEILARLNKGKRFIFDASHPVDLPLVRTIACDPFDVIIAGAGPAGLQMAIELSRKKITCLLLEKDLLLDSNNTIAVPNDIVKDHELRSSVAMEHEDSGFSDYFGLNYPAKLNYCILDQTKALALLAQKIDREYCTIIENCETRSCTRKGLGVRIRTTINGYRLMRYATAAARYPRAVSLLDVNKFIYTQHNPYVKVNRMAEYGKGTPEEDNPVFRGSLMVDAAGFRSNIANSLHRSSSGKAWKCLVWEFENFTRPQKQIIWDLSVPTRTHVNFWVDVSGLLEAAVGVMGLTEMSPACPDGSPGKRELEEHLIQWIKRRSITGRIVRERYGIIPMTDFQERAVYDNIIFIGLSAIRQIPNTGFGFFPALHEASLASSIISDALKRVSKSGRRLRKQSFLHEKFLHRYDIAWLHDRELSMALDLVFQDLHLGARTDEYFHEFAKKSTGLPNEIVRRRILALMEPKDLWAFTWLFLSNSQLLAWHRYEPAYRQKIIRDIGRVLYCFVSQLLCFYCPEGSDMFSDAPPKGRYPTRLLKRFDIVLRRKIPEFICCLAANILFIEIFHLFIQFPGKTISLVRMSKLRLQRAFRSFRSQGSANHSSIVPETGTSVRGI